MALHLFQCDAATDQKFQMVPVQHVNVRFTVEAPC